MGLSEQGVSCAARSNRFEEGRASRQAKLDAEGDVFKESEEVDKRGCLG